MGEEYLYHYTNANALISIVAHRCLWASEYSYLNDGLEGKLIPNILETMVKHPEVFSTKKSNEKYTTALLHQLRHLKTFFLASFSTRSNMLAQFRMYCPPAGGYVVGFPRSFLASAGALVDVEYNRDGHIRWCRDFFDRYVQAAMRLDAPEKDAERLNYDVMCDGAWVEERTHKGIACKSDEFSAEREVRLLYKKSGPIQVNVRATSNGSLFIPYVEIPLPNEEVTVQVAAGPSRFPDLALRGMQELVHVARNAGTKWQVSYLSIGEFGYRDLA